MNEPKKKEINLLLILTCFLHIRFKIFLSWVTKSLNPSTAAQPPTPSSFSIYCIVRKFDQPLLCYSTAVFQSSSCKSWWKVSISRRKMRLVRSIFDVNHQIPGESQCLTLQLEYKLPVSSSVVFLRIKCIFKEKTSVGRTGVDLGHQLNALIRLFNHASN